MIREGSKSRPWTVDEDRLLMSMLEQGKRRALIARTLGRTEVSVISRLGILRGIERRKKEQDYFSTR